MHATTNVGPIRNSTVGVHDSECFTTQAVAVQYGRQRIRQISQSSRTAFAKSVSTRETELETTLVIDGVDKWKATTRSCDSTGCRVRVRVPRTVLA